MTDISILIPAYNAESLLPRCLDSILAQPTSLEVEIIIVDDGSSDDTYAIAQAYAERDARIKTLTGPRGGAGAARNRAISLGSGKYFWFVDADDRIREDAFVHLERELNNTSQDVLIFYYNLYVDGAKNYIGMLDTDTTVYNSIPADTDFTLAEFPILLRTQAYTWHQLFRSEFVLANHLLFSNTPVTNDIYFVISAYLTAKTIRLSRDCIYAYRFVDYENTDARKTAPYGAVTAIRDERRLSIIRILSDCDALFASLSRTDDIVKNYWLAKLEHLSWGISTIREDLRPQLETYARDFLTTIPSELLREFWENNLILKRPLFTALLKPVLTNPFALSQQDFTESSPPFLSIIIPAWNVEKELPRCLDSIFSQTASLSFECIVVDDGSTDGTYAVMEDFQKRFPQMRLLRQKHAGGGSARNNALDAAQGRYIWPVDADDTITEDAFAEIRNMLEGADGDLDMLVFAYKQYFIQEDIFKSQPKQMQNAFFAKEMAGKIFNAVERPEIFATVPFAWHCLLRRNFVISHSFRWSEKIYLHDEFPFIIPLRWVAKKILASDKAIYVHYIDNMRSDSDNPQMRHITDRRRYMVMDGITEAKGILKELDISNLALLHLDIFLFDTVNWVISLIKPEMREPLVCYARESLAGLSAEHLRFLYKNLPHCGYLQEIIGNILRLRSHGKRIAFMEKNESATTVVPLPKRIGFVAWELLNYETDAARRLLVLAQALRLQGHEVCIFHCGKRASTPFVDPVLTLVDISAPNEKKVEKIREKILNWRPDVLCLFLEMSEAMWFPAALRGTGIPFVISEQYGKAFYGSRAWTQSEYDACLAAADLLHRPLAGQAVPCQAKNAMVIPNPVLPEDEFLPGKGDENATRLRIIAVGPFAQRRRLGLLIQAFCLAAEHHPDWDLYLYGEVYDRWAHEKPLRQAGLKDRVVFAGLPARDMYATAHLLCVPSIYEPLAPEYLLEAMRRGIPVLGFQHSALEEIIVTGENGILLAKEGMAAALAGGMRLYMQSDFLRKEYGAGGMAWAEAHDAAAATALVRWNEYVENLVNLQGRTSMIAPNDLLAEFLERKHPYLDRPKKVLEQLGLFPMAKAALSEDCISPDAPAPFLAGV
ncbi:MAG: glycosyltransferase, partial [Desulfovibrio sp.]|nr:glycosyltransferase [Desulfovibrio sp.]